MNYILFYMSTLPREILQNNFTYTGKSVFKEGTVVENCQSQLEPITKLILENDLEADYKIIMLCSDATLNKNKYAIDIKDGGGIIGHVVPQEITAANFFIKRIRDSLFNNEELDENVNDSNLPISFKGTNGREVSFEIIEIDKEQLPISDENTKTLNSIMEVVSLLRREKRKEDKLYIVSNGGFRSNVDNLKVIVNVLKHDDIMADAVFSTNTSNNTIINDNETPNLLEFASAMDEFLDYGEIRNLKNYFSKRLTEEELERDSLMMHMINISENLKLCRPSFLLDEIKKLSNEINKENGGNPIEKLTEYEIFKSTIKDDYGIIINNSNNIMIINIISWCLKKELYMQAYAFAEDQIASDIVNEKIFHILTDDTSEKTNEVLSKSKNEKHDIFEYFIKQLSLYRVVLKSFNDLFKDNNEIESFIKNFSKLDYQELCYKLENIKYTKIVEDKDTHEKKPVKMSLMKFMDKCLFKKNADQIYIRIEENMEGRKITPVGLTVKIEIPDDEEGMKYRLLFALICALHRFVKKTRNDLFHMNKDFIGYQKSIKLITMYRDAIDLFLSYFEGL